MSEYDIYCDFNLELHKKTFIHYLEVIIDPQGKVYYAIPSHQMFLVDYACEKLHIDRKKLYNKCPEERFYDFMGWLCELTGCVSVWEKFIEGKPNDIQRSVLKELADNGLYLGEY